MHLAALGQTESPVHVVVENPWSTRDWLLFGANIVLALVAAYSVVQAHRARAAAVLPKVVVVPLFEGESRIAFALRNVGVGPALDVAVTVAFREGERIGLTRAALAPGGQVVIRPRESDATMEEVARTYPRIETTGSCKDTFGKRVTVAHRLLLDAEVRAAVDASVEPDEEPLSDVTNELRRLANAVENLQRLR